MPIKQIQIRAKHTDGITTVRALIDHPMSNGVHRAEYTGKKIRPHFIQEVICTLDDEVVMQAYWGENIARDPLIGFTFKGGAKDKVIKISWVDNQGNSDSVVTTIS